MNFDALVPVGWADSAACAEVDPELFFPEGQGQQIRKQVLAAREVCYRCPVLRNCAGWALETASGYVVWAGVHLGSQSGDRRIARERLRDISGVALPTPRRRTAPKKPFVCAGTCGRSVRPIRSDRRGVPGDVDACGVGDVRGVPPSCPQNRRGRCRMNEVKVGDEIDDTQQLVELPVGSIVRTGAARCAQKAWMRDPVAAEDDEWFETGDSTPITSADLDDYPHLLLYIGGQLS